LLLNKDQVKDFKEDQLEVFAQKFIRSFKRQMTVYYNILNILGDRMQKKIQTKAHQNKDQHGSIMEPLKHDVEYQPKSTKGQSKPNIPSSTSSSLFRRPVSESNSPSLLMEFSMVLETKKLLHLKSSCFKLCNFQ
jgi:hypothetical protein